MKEAMKKLLPLVLMLAVLAVFLLPQRLADKKAEQFGEPLFAHTLPEGAELIQQDATKGRDGSTMAALILKTDLTAEELEAFYSDTVYPPAKEGQTVEMRCKALDEASLDALKQAELYEEGASYLFVFISSR